MIKRINFVKIIIVLFALIVFNFTVGLFISPAITSFMTTQLNKNTAAKVSLDKVQIWPLTLNVRLINLKVFDPKDVNKRIISVPDASFRLSVLGLLSKRIVVSRATLKNAEISLEGRKDGTFNVQDIVKRGESKPQPITAPKSNDTFGRVYNIVKNNFSKKQAGKTAQAQKERKEVTKTVENLPKGKVVHFKTTKHRLEIVDLDFSNAMVSFRSVEGNNVEITKAKIRLKNFGIDPELGMKIGSFSLAATLSKDKAKLGGVSITGVNKYVNDLPRLNLDVQLKELNIKPLEFIYQDSLPVEVKKGILNLNSKTTIAPEELNSHNDLRLKDYVLSPKQNVNVGGGFMPIDIICDALNDLGVIHLKFNITGTPDNPEFKGFNESLNKLIGPVAKKIGERMKEQGLKILEENFKKKGEANSTQTGTQQDTKKSSNPLGILKSIIGETENSK